MLSDDAFYVLPDSLLCLILSKTPIIDAVKTSILSRRWRFLYTQMPKINFSPHPILSTISLEKYENFISNLLRRSCSLESLIIQGMRWDFSYESLCEWVRCAAQCNVKELRLMGTTVEKPPPPALFSCSRLETLGLATCDLTSFPIDFVGFPRLICCELFNVTWTNESVASLLNLCPLLKKFAITARAEVDYAVISSSTVYDLEMCRVKSLTVNCPKLTKLAGRIIGDLYVNGVRFYDLADNFFKLRMDCGGTIRKLTTFTSPRWSASRFLNTVGSFQSLKKLAIYTIVPFEREGENDVRLLNLLSRLPVLQSLSIQEDFVQELKKDPIPDCLASPHLNLKKIRISLVSGDEEEIALISCLLQSTPILESMEISLFKNYNDDSYRSRWTCLFDNILHLRRASSIARVTLNDPVCSDRTKLFYR